MNVATIVLALVVAGLFVFAVRYLRSNGMCSACEDKQACQAARGGSSPLGRAGGLGGTSGSRLAALRGCSSCDCAAACLLQDTLTADSHDAVLDLLTLAESRTPSPALPAGSPQPRT